MCLTFEQQRFEIHASARKIWHFSIKCCLQHSYMARFIVTINILKIRELFVHFKSYLLKFRRQYELLCCLLAKIRAFLQN